MADELLINAIPGEVRAAIVSDGRLVDIQIEREGRQSQVGNIYLGRVERVIPGMDAAFVDMGTERSGFLGLDAAAALSDNGGGRISDYVHEGEAITVQIVKDAIGRKGAQLARRITLPGRYLVYAPQQSRISISRQIEDETERQRLQDLMDDIADDGEGFILRTAAVGAGADELQRDAAYLREVWQDIEDRKGGGKAPMALHADIETALRTIRDNAYDNIQRIVIDDREVAAAAERFCSRFMPDFAERVVFHEGPEALFDAYNVEDDLYDALESRVTLPSGGTLVIESTEALTAIDVNSGRNTGSSSLEETAYQTNMEAAAEAARQIRLRNIGGLIVIDFIHMDEDARWDDVTGRLGDAMAGDRTHSRLMARTEAGLIEMTRRRRRESLAQMLTERCEECEGSGRISTVDTVIYDIARALGREAQVAPPGGLMVIAADEVSAALNGNDSDIVEDAARLSGRRIEVRPDPSYGRDMFDISYV